MGNVAAAAGCPTTQYRLVDPEPVLRRPLGPAWRRNHPGDRFSRRGRSKNYTHRAAGHVSRQPRARARARYRVRKSDATCRARGARWVKRPPMLKVAVLAPSDIADAI